MFWGKEIPDLSDWICKTSQLAILQGRSLRFAESSKDWLILVKWAEAFSMAIDKVQYSSRGVGVESESEVEIGGIVSSTDTGDRYDKLRQVFCNSDRFINYDVY